MTDSFDASNNYILPEDIAKLEERTKAMAEIKEGRAVGNSTRQIDEAVQTLFNNREVTIIDHEDTRHKLASKLTFNRFIKRLELEHRWLFEAKALFIDERNNHVKFKNK